MKSKFTTEDFIFLSKKKYGDKFDYSKAIYVNKDTRICLINKDGSESHVLLRSHLNLSKEESDNYKKEKTIKAFFEEMAKKYNGLYDYSESNCASMDEAIKIRCTKHNVYFYQTPKAHKKSAACPVCRAEQFELGRIEREKTFIENAKKVHGDLYDYSKVHYVNNETPITIIDKEYGEFQQLPATHLSGHGCPKRGLVAMAKTHIKEPSVIENNNEIDTDFDKTKDEFMSYVKSINNGLESIDEPEYGIIILGQSVGFNFVKTFNISNDQNTMLPITKKYNEKNIRLVHIFEDEWMEKTNIVKDLVKSILNLSERRVYARNCDVVELENDECYNFIETNHIQGKCFGAIKIGLKCEGELVSVMLIGKGRVFLNRDCEYELLRMCSKQGVSVVGGASKMFKYFIDKYNPNDIISYADRRFSMGNVYDKLGFTLYNESQPNYYYIMNNKRVYRYSLRKDILVSKYGCPSDVSEQSFCNSKGWYRVYDCGCYCYKWSDLLLQ